ncbi:MAG: putative Ig domain-containing protein [Candidatus Sulfotelmatobacter sp.]
MSVFALSQQSTVQSASSGELAADKSAPKDSLAEAAQDGAAAQNQGNDQDTDQNNDRDNEGLQIEPAELPDTYPRGPYHVRFYGKGNYVPTLHWKVIKGKLPPGITLNDDGTLQGAAQRAGDFNFVVAVKDGSQPQQAVQRGFVIKVVDAMTVAWKVPAHVSGSRIEGSVDVSNTTPDDIDLTYDVKAVADNGRATEIGYQHFPLKKGTIGMTLPFGETLPNGAYTVNVSVEGEIAKRKAIYRQQLQSPGPLHVAVSP